VGGAIPHDDARRPAARPVRLFVIAEFIEVTLDLFGCGETAEERSLGRREMVGRHSFVMIASLL
jgi:hypothetical protein